MTKSTCWYRFPGHDRCTLLVRLQSGPLVVVRYRPGAETRDIAATFNTAVPLSPTDLEHIARAMVDDAEVTRP